MADNNQVKLWFENTFTLDKEGLLHKDYVETLFKEKFKNLHCRDELKALKLSIKYDSQKIITYSGKKYKGFWVGMREEGTDIMGNEIEDGLAEAKGYMGTI